MTCIFSFLYTQHTAPLCGLFWNSFLLFLNPVVSAAQVLSGHGDDARMKQASKYAALGHFHLSGKEEKRERERERHNTDTYIPCTCSKPTEGVHAHVHETQVAESQSEMYMPPDIQV